MTTDGSLQSVRPRFDERSPLLGVTLGVIALLRRFRLVLRRYGAPSNTAVVPRDEFLLVVLGLISLSRTAMSRRRHVRPAPGVTSRRTPSSSHRPQRDRLLR